MEVQGVNTYYPGTSTDIPAVHYPATDVAWENAESPVNPYDKRSKGEDSYTKKFNPDNGEEVEKLQDAIQKTNKVLEPSFRYFEISVHEKSHRVMVKVMDTATKELIREIPPEKFLDMVAGFIEMAGLMVDTRA